jgi:transposase
MFAFFRGRPRLVVPDNLKSGIHKPSFYDPEINRSYARMAAHYEVGILPARPRKPRDKAKSLPQRRRGLKREFASPNPIFSAACAT